MKLVDVDGVYLLPPVLLHQIQIVDTSTVRVPVSGVVNGPLSEVDSLVNGKVWPVEGVQDAISVGGT